jgi:ABC-type dipeptide/oligopeptide/nickel transport system permease component
MGLRDYIIRRLLLMIPIVLGVVVLIFAIIQFVPVNSRVVIYMSGSVRELNPEIIAQYIHMYGLDQPIWVQFATWLSQVLVGNFGYSETSQELVLRGLLVRIPATFEIVMFAAPLIIFIGIWLGVKSAVQKDKPFDQATRIISILGTSLPSFFFGIILTAIFIGQMRWVTAGRLSPGLNTDLLLMLKSGGWTQYTSLITIDSLLNFRLNYFVDALEHLIMPVTVLVFIQTAVLVRVTRSSMLEALGKTYITAARAKGLTRDEVIYKHARRNALIPVVTISGLLVGGMMTGLIITETVFLFPGIGSWAAIAAQRFDVPVVAAYAMFSAIVFVIANLIVDVLYAYIDPRIRLG